MYDPLAKIPLIIKYPGNREAGTRRSELVSNVDVAPTLLKQCGLGSGGLPGKDLAERIDRPYVFAEQGNGSQYMLRSTTRKLIYGHNVKQRLFFDLESDPFELENVYEAPEYREEVQSYIRKLSDFVLFETLPPSHLDDRAPVVLPEAAQRQAAEWHSTAEQWFRERMNAILPDSQ
jgi:arylsulfatase A-like enzyme